VKDNKIELQVSSEISQDIDHTERKVVKILKVKSAYLVSCWNGLCFWKVRLPKPYSKVGLGQIHPRILEKRQQTDSQMSRQR
jgi:hypothetical protein